MNAYDEENQTEEELEAQNEKYAEYCSGVYQTLLPF